MTKPSKRLERLGCLLFHPQLPDDRPAVAVFQMDHIDPGAEVADIQFMPGAFGHVLHAEPFHPGDIDTRIR